MFNYNDEYFDNQEARCIKRLRDFNDSLRWFDTITPNALYSHIDATAIDRKGRKTHIEMKERRGTIEKYIEYGDLLIEAGKLEAFSNIAESGHALNEQRLYINFVDDGVIVFNIDKLSNLAFYPNHKHRNLGRKKDECEDRFGLSIKEALLYKKEGGTYKRFET